MGFCSQECYENAKKDLLIKNIAGDEFDYQAIRDSIKKIADENGDKDAIEALRQQVVKHLEDELGVVKFNHAVSQKETVIFQD